MQQLWTNESAQEYLRKVIRFVDPRSRYQRPLKKELIHKAFGSSINEIWDMTCGLGEDGWILTRLGYHVTSFEKNNFLFSCLQKAKAEADRDPYWTDISKRWRIYFGDSITFLGIQKEFPEACYLDPMFTFEKSLSALPRKEMQALRYLLRHEGSALSIDQTLEFVLNRVKKRVVLKWHRKLPRLSLKPNHVVDGDRVQFLVFFP